MKKGKLSTDDVFDVAIIGGGITGVLNAYYLSKAHKKVVLFEADKVGHGATQATTAFITQIIDTEPSKLESLFGKEKTSKIFRSHGKAIDEMDTLVKKEKINCDFVRCSNYLYASTRRQAKVIEEEIQYLNEHGVNTSGFKTGGDLGFSNQGYIEVFKQAKFSAVKFVDSIAQIARDKGAIILENHRVMGIHDDGIINIKTSGGVFRAKKVLIATYKPFTNKSTHLKKGMYRTYVFEVEIPKGLMREAIYEDSGNPYHYFRIDKGELTDKMIIGGEDHKDIFGKSLRLQSFKGLQDYLKKILPGVKNKILNRWDGPILEPSDGLPLIGEIKPNYYVATAFSGNGMTYSMISSQILKDIMYDKENIYADVYDPKRTLFHPKRLASKAKDYVEEFFGGALKNLLT